jgi:hypothetical protein
MSPRSINALRMITDRRVHHLPVLGGNLAGNLAGIYH